MTITVSGRPIIQDGKLVGAVTHVLVNDPTRGYILKRLPSYPLYHGEVFFHSFADSKYYPVIFFLYVLK